MSLSRTFLIGLSILVGPGPLGAQSDPRLESYTRARAILERAAVSHADSGAMEGMRDLTVSYIGTRYMRYQSRAAGLPWDTQVTEWRTVVDYAGARMRRDFVERYPLDFEFAGTQVFTADGGFRFDPTRANVGDALTQFTTLNFERGRAGMDWDMPGLLVERALRRAQTLLSLGTAAQGGRSFDVVAFADQDGSMVSLYFDARTGLLHKHERLRDDGIDGDVTAAVGFDDYRSIAGIRFPTRRIEWLGDEIVREGTLTTHVNTSPPDSLFAKPGGYVDPVRGADEREPVRRLAENVWLIQQLGNRVMFVTFDDHVMVFEAPLPQSSATAVLEIVRRTVPGKPVRYVTFTHHHDDHGGGLRAYIAEGITIVTTPGTRAFVERVARAHHSIAPDTLSRAPRSPVIETFSGSRVFTDGSTTVELHELGPNSHVDEMVLAWLPGEQLIFQGDLLILPDQGDLPRANTLSTEFLRKIDAMDWLVERIAGVHGRVGTLAELREMVAKRPNPGN